MTLAFSTLTDPNLRRKTVVETIPAAAADKARNMAALRLGKAQDRVRELNNRPLELKVGMQVKLLRGYNEGKVGKLVWWGTAKFGKCYAIALTDAKLPNGRYADVVYSKPRNVRFLISEREAAEKELIEARETYWTFEEEECLKEVLRLYGVAASAWGVTENALFVRAVEVLTEEVNQLEERHKYLTENDWACDGPAYNQVQQQSESFYKRTKMLCKIVAALKERLS